MKRYILPGLVLLALVAGCKKDSTVTPDGKPKADAASNTLRVDVSGSDAYDLSLSVTDASSTHLADFSKNGITASYEYVTTATAGQRLFLNIQSNTFGSTLNCDIYYKGVKVQLSDMVLEKRDGQPITQSHIFINYLVGHTGP